MTKSCNRDKGKLLTVKKLSKLYGIHEQKIYYYLRNRYFPFFKVNKNILFWERDFIDFLEKYAVPPDQSEEFIVDDDIEL